MSAGNLEVLGTGGTPDDELVPDLVDSPLAGRSPTQIALDRLRKDKVAMISLAIVIFFVLIAVFAPLIIKLFGVELRQGSTNDTDVFGYPLIGPPDNGFTWAAPLGLAPKTGNDNLADFVYGARTSLSVATVAAIVSTLIGIVVGLLAGYSRGWLDRFITWMIDFFLSLPFLLVALSLAPIIVIRFRDQPDQLKTWQFVALLFVLSLFSWMTLARLIRGEVLSLREREFVQAAQVIGVPTRRILFKELLPNLIAPIVVSISLGLPAFVAAEAALAYLGIGVVGIPSWGQTINSATGYYQNYWLYLWAPIFGVLTLVVSLNLLGDAVRDAFDPKTRR